MYKFGAIFYLVTGVMLAISWALLFILPCFITFCHTAFWSLVSASANYDVGYEALKAIRLEKKHKKLKSSLDPEEKIL